MSMKLATLFYIALLSALISSDLSQAVLDPKDYLALQSIRSSLYDLPGSAFFSTWDFTADPCSTFSGLLCSANRVISLSLGSPAAGSPGLSGHLPSSLSSLTALTHLSLVQGRVSGPIPNSLSQCTNLRFLALSHNYLSGPIPRSLANLKYLHTLDLSFNLLSGPIPAFTQQQTSLSNLILAHNRLTGNLPNTFPASLTRLDLKQNNLSGPLHSLPHRLTYLSLSSNQLSGNIGSVISKMSAMNFLDLSRNRFTGEIPGEVFGFPGIGEIRLQRNVFTGPVRVVGTVAARTVDLSYNGLGGSVPEGLANAERIYLNCNRFVGRVPGRYGERMREGRIEVLYLQRNYLAGMDGVDAVPGRVTLCLNYNCMVPPRGNVCPVRTGRWKRRPERECKLVPKKKH